MTSRTSAVRNGARLERRLADLDVRRRLQLIDQRGFTQQRFELGADLLPLRGGNPRERRFQTAPSPQREVRAQPASQPFALPTYTAPPFSSRST